MGSANERRRYNVTPSLISWAHARMIYVWAAPDGDRLNEVKDDVGLILGLRPANERRRCFATVPLIGWAQA